MTNFLALAVGAVLGAALRYAVTLWAVTRWGTAFPYGTLLVNGVGCFVLGFFATLGLVRGEWSPATRLLVATGFCGSLTTFSTFSYETVELMVAGRWGAGVLNAVGSVGLGLAATLAGIALARWVSG